MTAEAIEQLELRTELLKAKNRRLRWALGFFGSTTVIGQFAILALVIVKF